MPFARFSWLIALIFCCVTIAIAEESAPLLSDELRGLIQQLDADDFGERQAASQALAKKGKQAIPALEEAIRGESVEAASRSFELLQRLFTKGDLDAKATAQSALERLAKGDDAAARRAQQLLKPATPEEVPHVPAGRPRIRLGGGGAPIRIPVAPAAVVRRSVKVQINNGLKTIEVDDNGKRIKIVDDPAKGIELETIQIKDGKETTEKFAARNAQELKTKHPEAFKVYEEFAKGGPNNIRVQVGAPNPAAMRDALQESVKRLDEQIEKIKNDPASPAEIRKKHLEALERHRDRLKESLKETEEEGKK